MPRPSRKALSSHLCTSPLSKSTGSQRRAVSPPRPNPPDSTCAVSTPWIDCPLQRPKIGEHKAPVVQRVNHSPRHSPEHCPEHSVKHSPEHVPKRNTSPNISPNLLCRCSGLLAQTEAPERRPKLHRHHRSVTKRCPVHKTKQTKMAATAQHRMRCC